MDLRLRYPLPERTWDLWTRGWSTPSQKGPGTCGPEAGVPPPRKNPGTCGPEAGVAPSQKGPGTCGPEAGVLPPRKNLEPVDLRLG